MPLDLPTLFVVSTCITALLGLFLLYLWIQDRTIRALGWWAAAYLIGGFAVALWGMRTLIAQAWLDEVASALLFVCCGMIWCGARRLRGRRIEPVTALAGAVVWILASLVPAFADWFGARVVLSSITTTVYAVMTAIELRQDRRNPGAAGLRAVILPVLHGAVFLSPILTISVLPNSEEIGKLTFPLFALMTLLYVVGTAFIVVVMAKERSLLLHKTAAQTDPLTGLFNRRGFEEAAQKTLQAKARKNQVVTVLMFDLDHFKSINDRYGHQFGDETLCRPIGRRGIRGNPARRRRHRLAGGRAGAHRVCGHRRCDRGPPDRRHREYRRGHVDAGRLRSCRADRARRQGALSRQTRRARSGDA